MAAAPGRIPVISAGQRIARLRRRTWRPRPTSKTTPGHSQPKLRTSTFSLRSESAGYPTQVFIDGGTKEHISHWERLSGTVNDSDGDPHLVGISYDLQIAALGGRESGLDIIEGSHR